MFKGKRFEMKPVAFKLWVNRVLNLHRPTDVAPGVLGAQQVLDERRLAGAVLPEQQHVGLALEVPVAQWRKLNVKGTFGNRD